MNSAFHDWIQSDGIFGLLKGCARNLAFRAEKMGMPLDDDYLRQGDVGDFHMAVAADLWQFLKEHADRLGSKASVILASGDSARFASFITGEFLDNCLDKRRTDSPFHAYYRHMRTVLSQAEDIQYQAESRKGAFYAWSRQTPLPFLPDSYEFINERLCYDAWSASTVPFREIHEKQAMVLLSRHYWDEAIRLLIEEYLLPIRELVRFVSAKYPLVPRESVDERTADGDDQEDDSRYGSERPSLPFDIIDSGLECLARDCAHEMSETERQVLVLLAEHNTLVEIAKKLGMKVLSNVSYHQKKAFIKMRTKWNLWGLPDSEHVSVAEEEQEIFFKKVVTFCKEADQFRVSRSEGQE